MKTLWKILPWCCLALFATEIVVVMLPKGETGLQVREFGRLPALLDGRFQPFDSIARNSLLQIRSTGDLPLEQLPRWQFWRHPKKLKSTEWLMEVFAKPEVADTRPVFLIHHAELLGELRLDEKGVERSGLRYYTFNELKPVFDEISQQGRKASELKSEDQTTFHKQVIKLSNALMLYQRLKVSLQPEGMDHFSTVLSEFETNIVAARAAAQASESGKSFDEAAVRKVAGPLQHFQVMAQYAYPLVIPPLAPGATKDDWVNMGTSLMQAFRTGEVHPAARFLATLTTAYRHGDEAEFNQAVAAYREWLQPKFAAETRKARAEFYYNQVKAFLHATIIYIAAFVLAGAGLLTLAISPPASEAFRRSALYLVILAGVVHTFGLIFRMALEGRPPVTNLYSSAVFIGWGAMLFGIIIEYVYRVGIGSIIASTVGFVTLIIAHNLALGGDTMQMLRAVLDTNFWLATHVVVITLGYSAVFAAGLVGILYIFLGIFTPLLTRKVQARPPTAKAAAGAVATAPIGEGQEIGKALAKMVYGIICFGTLFSFVGTVLGGIWADQSWGRFWGWDPKENGALLIVLWCAIILHARWGGLVRERGLMNLAIFGNIVTAFSWFGVNMLNIGLHSYGFMEAGSKWLMVFYTSQLLIIALSFVPREYWRSFRQVQPAPSAPPAHTSRPGKVAAEPAG